jgi:hypothetical protein
MVPCAYNVIRWGMAKQEIIPVRVTRADRAALKAAAGKRPVSTWLRELGLEEARRRAAARSVGALLDAARSGGFGLDEAAAEQLAEEATHASRRGRGG